MAADRARPPALAWGLGNLYYSVAFVDTPPNEVPFPSLADLGYLAFYPPIFVGAGLLARARLVRFAHMSWIDVVIAALTAGAVAAAVVFERVLASTGGDAAAVATNLAYPLADAVLLAGITGALVLAGRRVTRSWLLLACGLGCFAVSDSVYLVRVSADAYEYGSLLDLGWIMGTVLLALAGTVRDSAVRSTSAGSLPYVPAVFGLIGVALLTYDHFVSINGLALVLAVAGLLAVVARMTLSLSENERLLRRTRSDAETDALTRLRNRRKLKADLDAVCAEQQSHVLLMFDLDGFKGYNDTFGHPAGTRCCSGWGSAWRRSAAPVRRRTGSAATSSACSCPAARRTSSGCASRRRSRSRRTARASRSGAPAAARSCRSRRRHRPRRCGSPTCASTSRRRRAPLRACRR
jgi:hypothetical protein